jgi:hypothetical protein
VCVLPKSGKSQVKTLIPGAKIAGRNSLYLGIDGSKVCGEQKIQGGVDLERRKKVCLIKRGLRNG